MDKILAWFQPYKLAALAIGLGIVGIGLVSLGVSWYVRGQKVEALSSYQESVQRAVTPAGSDLLSPEQSLAAIGTLKKNVETTTTELRRISNEATAAKARADAADARLAQQLADFERRYQAATRRIADLERRQAAATPEEAAVAIEEDSKAAWEGWR